MKRHTFILKDTSHCHYQYICSLMGIWMCVVTYIHICVHFSSFSCTVKLLFHLLCFSCLSVRLCTCWFASWWWWVRSTSVKTEWSTWAFCGFAKKGWLVRHNNRYRLLSTAKYSQQMLTRSLILWIWYCIYFNVFCCKTSCFRFFHLRSNSIYLWKKHMRQLWTTFSGEKKDELPKWRIKANVVVVG